MGRGWCVDRPGSVTGQRVSRYRLRSGREHTGPPASGTGSCCTETSQRSHLRAEHKHAWLLQRPRLGRRRGVSRWPHLGGPRAVHRR